MSDTAVIPEVSLDDLIQFLAEKWKTAACPRCDHLDWRTGEAASIKALVPVGVDSLTSVASTRFSLPMYWLICANCGHVELLGAKAVQHWKDASRD